MIVFRADFKINQLNKSIGLNIYWAGGEANALTAGGRGHTPVSPSKSSCTKTIYNCMEKPSLLLSFPLAKLQNIAGV